MFDAELLLSESAVYSPWFPRQGDNVTVTLEVVEIAGTNAKIKLELWTKNTDDKGDGENCDENSNTKIERTAVGRSSTTWIGEGLTPGLEELVRYKLTVTGTAPAWVLFRGLEPVWFDSVDA